MKKIVKLTSLCNKIITPPKQNSNFENVDFAMPCFPLGNIVGVKNGKEISTRLSTALNDCLSENNDYLTNVTSAGPYVNFTINTETYGKLVIDNILEHNILEAKKDETLDKVMIEYSQPNTHKAFHVGHMRNCALGDSLIFMNN